MYNRPAAMKKLHILGVQQGLDHAELHALAKSLLNVESLSKLTDAQLSWMIRHLMDSSKAGPAPVRNMITQRKIWKINELTQQLGMTDNPLRLAGFIARQCKGKRELKSLAVWEASRVIEGLKNLMEHPDAA